MRGVFLFLSSIISILHPFTTESPFSPFTFWSGWSGFAIKKCCGHSRSSGHSMWWHCLLLRQVVCVCVSVFWYGHQLIDTSSSKVVVFLPVLNRLKAGPPLRHWHWNGWLLLLPHTLLLFLLLSEMMIMMTVGPQRAQGWIAIALNWLTDWVDACFLSSSLALLLSPLSCSLLFYDFPLLSF